MVTPVPPGEFVSPYMEEVEPWMELFASVYTLDPYL
jgi:hypothetical protein